MLAWMRGHTEYVDLEACRWVENQFDFHSYLGPGSDLTNIFSGCTYKVGQEKIEKSGWAWVYSMTRYHGDLAVAFPLVSSVSFSGLKPRLPTFVPAGSTRGFLRGWNLATAISSVWTMMALAPWPLPMPTTVSLGWHSLAPRLPGWKPWGPRCPSWRLDDWTSKRAIFQSTTKLGTSLAVIIFSSALEAAQENVSFPTFSAVFFCISSTGGAEDQSYFCREAGCDLRVKAESKLGTPQKMDG